MRDQGNQANKTAAKPQERGDYTDLPVGEILRRTRVQFNLSLTDVESALRIRAAQLGAIESGRHDQLPGRVYAIGFVRAYSEFLGLDGAKMVHLFKVQSVGSKNRPELSFPVPASESKLPNFYILGASLAGLIAVIMLFFSFNSPAPQMEIPPGPVAAVADLPAEHTPLEAAMMSAIAPAAGTPAATTPAAPAADPLVAAQQATGQPAPAAAAPMPTAQEMLSAAQTQQIQQQVQTAQQKPLPTTLGAPMSGVAAATPVPVQQQIAALSPAQTQASQVYQVPAPVGPKIVFNVRNDVWVEIRDSEGKPLVSRILRPGEQFVVPQGQGLVMDTGNAGAFDVYLNGKKMAPLGVFGNVRRNISLAPEKLTAAKASGQQQRTTYHD